MAVTRMFTRRRIVAGLVFLLMTFAVTVLKQAGRSTRGRVPISLRDVRLTWGDNTPVVDGDVLSAVHTVDVSEAWGLAATCGNFACPPFKDFSVSPAPDARLLAPQGLLLKRPSAIEVTTSAVIAEGGDARSVGGSLSISSATMSGAQTRAAQFEPAVHNNVAWASARDVTLQLQSSAVAGKTIFEDATQVRSIEGEVGADFSFRPNWYTRCEAAAGERIQASGSSPSTGPLVGTVRFSTDIDGVSLSLAPTVKPAICNDNDCKEAKSESACQQIWFKGDVLFDWTTLVLAALGVAAALLALRGNGVAAALLLALLSASCAAPTGSADRAPASLGGDNAAMSGPRAFQNPLLVLVAGGERCEKGTHNARSDITDVTAAEVKHFQDAHIEFTRVLARATELESALHQLASAGKLRNGLVLYYTGHAQLRQVFSNPVKASPAGSAEPQTHLCLDDWLPVSNLIGWLGREQAALPWAVLILDACESAFVDLSTVSFPISVLAASPEPVAVYNATSGSRVGFFARTVAAVLSNPAAHDPNGDGVVTDRELLAALLAASSARAFEDPLRARPRLQRQAPSSLPIRFYAETSGARKQLARLREQVGSSHDSTRVALAGLLEDQLRLGASGRLPKLRWDLVVTTEPMATMRCPGEAPQEPPWSCVPGRPDLRRLAPAFAGWASEIARLSTAIDVYEIRAVQGQLRWYDIVRLRDGRIMATTTHSPIAVVPARKSVVERTLDGNEWLVRSTDTIEPSAIDCRGRTPDQCEALSRKRRFMVCEEEEGQCFTASR